MRSCELYANHDKLVNSKYESSLGHFQYCLEVDVRSKSLIN